MVLRACPHCDRHHADSEIRCPFCGADLGAVSASRDGSDIGARLRAAALGTAIAAAAATQCARTQVPAYGIPPPQPEVDGTTDRDMRNVVPAYGGPSPQPTPVAIATAEAPDAGRDASAAPFHDAGVRDAGTDAGKTKKADAGRIGPVTPPPMPLYGMPPPTPPYTPE